jgi:hypothetical protein
MTMTNHATIRAAQRGVVSPSLRVVLEHGTEISMPGGAKGYYLAPQTVRDEIGRYQKAIDLMKRSSGIVAVMEGESVITVYRTVKKKNLQKRQRSRANEKKTGE